MNKKGLTISMVFEAQSANFGEGFGNITVLKKLTRGDGNMYTYISRQAMRYSIISQLGWENTPVDDKNRVVQFAPETSIKDYPEIDLFGYMKTKSKSEDEKGGANTRSAVVRLSNAVSLEPYNAELDFLNNMGLAKRGGFANAIAQSEIHKSFYAYTVAVDLDRVGIDGMINIENAEKANRVSSFLDTLLYLYRDIKGRRENLSPVFAIGGVYNRKVPYFENRIKLSKGILNIGCLKRIIDSDEEDIKKNTIVGCLPEVFANDLQIKEVLSPISISDMFKMLKGKVGEYYA